MILSHTLVWHTLSLSAASWLGLGYSFSLRVHYWSFFTPKDNNFVETFKCHMGFALRLV